ncbi:hypothetical protein ACJX0J_026713 [Zea mays]
MGHLMASSDCLYILPSSLLLLLLTQQLLDNMIRAVQGLGNIRIVWFFSTNSLGTYTCLAKKHYDHYVVSGRCLFERGKKFVLETYFLALFAHPYGVVSLPELIPPATRNGHVSFSIISSREEVYFNFFGFGNKIRKLEGISSSE